MSDKFVMYYVNVRHEAVGVGVGQNPFLFKICIIFFLCKDIINFLMILNWVAWIFLMRFFF